MGESGLMGNYGSYRLIEYLKEFGPAMLCRTSVTRVMRTLHLPGDLVSAAEEKKWKYIVSYLDRNYGSCIVEYRSGRDLRNLNRLDKTCDIWVFWWQGVVSAPPLVKACISSIERNAGLHKVNIVTKDNYADFVNIDERILDKVDAGLISFTHFSDILRFALLSQRGGIWMDATMYMTAPFPDAVVGLPYFTQPLGFGPGPWTDFFQGSGQGNPFTVSVSNILNEYNIVHEQILTYLLVDCAMRTVYEHSDDYAELVRLPPDLGNDMFALTKVLDEPYSGERWESIKYSSNFVSKLSYKDSHPTMVKGVETIYGKLLNEGRLP